MTEAEITGDKGQRYEIHVHPKFWDDGTSGTVAGWHETYEGASDMATSFILHPEVRRVWVIDRQKSQCVHDTKKAELGR